MERTEVAQPNAVAVLQGLDDFELQGVEHGFDVGARHGAAFLDEFYNLRQRERRGGCGLCVILCFCFLLWVLFPFDYEFNHCV